MKDNTPRQPSGTRSVVPGTPEPQTAPTPVSEPQTLELETLKPGGADLEAGTRATTAPSAQNADTSGGFASESATSRLARLLTMVPWLMNRQGIDIEQAAQTLGVSRRQIEADLALLFVCGTPGHLPDDLIEAEWEEGHVYVRNANEISRPLRLTRDEALALSVSLRTLLDVPGLSDRGAIDRALTKLAEASGQSVPAHEQVRVMFEGDPHEVLAVIRDALQFRRRLHLEYLVPSRDEVTERDVDPMRLVNIEGHWYLEGWCHRANDVRLFRLDRVEKVSALPEAAEIPQDARPVDLSQGFFAQSSDQPAVRLRLHPGAHWACEYYPCRDVRRHGDFLEASFPIADGRWIHRLLLRLGTQAQVMSPTSVREEVARQAREALRQYPDSMTGMTSAPKPA